MELAILPGLALVVALGMLLLIEVGRRHGHRLAARGFHQSPEGVGAIEAAVFALLGLLLAFQFGSGAARLEKRRDLVVQESNAIGTAWLRLDLLDPGQQPTLRNHFREYLDLRLAAYAALPRLDAAIDLSQRASALQGRIWQNALAAGRQSAHDSTMRLLLPALNEMFDVAAARDIVMLTHGSRFILLFLILVAWISALLAGYAISRADRRPWLHMVIFATLTASTIFVILDIEYPNLGWIHVGKPDQALRNLRQSFQEQPDAN